MGCRRNRTAVSRGKLPLGSAGDDHWHQKYLGSSLIKGIGPVMAKDGPWSVSLDTFDIIKTAERLTEDRRRRSEPNGLPKTCTEQKQMGITMVFLTGDEMALCCEDIQGIWR